MDNENKFETTTEHYEPCKDVAKFFRAQQIMSDRIYERDIKYNGTKVDIINDFYDNIERLQEKYKNNIEVLEALSQLEDIAIWWSNTPAIRIP